MKETIFRLMHCGNVIVNLNETYYHFQIYSDDVNGNITRSDQTVLTRFYIDPNHVRFALQKRDRPCEFDYTTYTISLDSELEQVKMLPDPHSNELYQVLKKYDELLAHMTNKED